MMLDPLARLFWPQAAPISAAERLRAAVGACIGIAITGLLGSLVVAMMPNLQSSLPALVAPMGASAVLLFAVPASPLAQPWSILGGNLVSAVIGVSAALIIDDPFIAAAAAVGLAIAAMMALRCLHPPSGAIALTAVLGGGAIHDLGYGFVLWPVFGNSLALLVCAVIFNNLTGRSYPHVAKPANTAPTLEGETSRPRIGFTRDDLDAVLKDYDQVLDIARGDLEDIIRRTELRSYRHRAVHLDCGTVMTRDVVAIAPESGLKEAHALMRSHHIKALPVTNEAAEVVGIVTQTDLLDKADWSSGKPSVGRSQRLRLLLRGAPAPNNIVRDIMTHPVTTVSPETPLGEAMVLFAEEGLHYLPVVRSNGKLAGIISQSDVLLATLSNPAAGA